jgi:type I restriction enzyme S subunit
MDHNGLPNGWVWTRISQIGDLMRGVSYKKDEASKEPRPGYLPILRASNIDQGLSTNDLVYVPNKRIAPEQLITKGDIVFAMSSGSKDLVGKAAQANNDFHAGFGAFCGLLRPSDKLEKRFTGYFFQSPDYKNAIRKLSSGVNINNLRRSHIEDSIFPLPPLPEQHRIVAKIEELFSDLDAGVAALQKVKAELKRYRQAVLKAAVEGKLTEEWRRRRPSDYESAGKLLERIRAERAKKGKTKTHSLIDKSDSRKERSGMTLLPELPEGWEWARAGDVAEMCLGKMLDKVKNKGESQPYLRNLNVRWGTFDLSDLNQMRFQKDEEQRYGLLPGDLVVCEGGEPGRAAVWAGTPGMKIQKALHRVRFVANTVVAEFLRYYLQYAAQNGILEKYFTGTTIKHLTGLRLGELVFPLPPFCEQQQIVSEVERRLSVANEVEKTVEASLKQAERLRQSILKKAFEGKLVPQDPSDEPAEKLLERIRANRNLTDFAHKEKHRTRKNK